jgi:hypothetical protein
MTSDNVTDYYQMLVNEFKEVTKKYFSNYEDDPEASAMASLEMIRIAKKYREKIGEIKHAS